MWRAPVTRAAVGSRAGCGGHYTARLTLHAGRALPLPGVTPRHDLTALRAATNLLPHVLNSALAGLFIPATARWCAFCLLPMPSAPHLTPIHCPFYHTSFLPPIQYGCSYFFAILLALLWFKFTARLLPFVGYTTTPLPYSHSSHLPWCCLPFWCPHATRLCLPPSAFTTASLPAHIVRYLTGRAFAGVVPFPTAPPDCSFHLFATCG